MLLLSPFYSWESPGCFPRVIWLVNSKAGFQPRSVLGGSKAWAVSPSYAASTFRYSPNSAQLRTQHGGTCWQEEPKASGASGSGNGNNKDDSGHVMASAIPDCMATLSWPQWWPFSSTNGESDKIICMWQGRTHSVLRCARTPHLFFIFYQLIGALPHAPGLWVKRKGRN